MASSDSEHEVPPVDEDGEVPSNGTAIADLSTKPTLPKELIEALCNEPYNEAWKNNIDEALLDYFRDGKEPRVNKNWQALFKREALKVHDQLAFKGIVADYLRGVYRVEHYARMRDHFEVFKRIERRRYRCRDIIVRRDGRNLGTLYEILVDLTLWKRVRKTALGAPRNH
ncbi:MAG: hypothetical protein Q9208_000063 [Pyrenodesmia sp. 3 TL-2023]